VASSRKFRYRIASSVVVPMPHGQYDSGLMKRGEAARRVIADGEDPLLMLLQVVWPDHDWAESAMLARLTACPNCSDAGTSCDECGNTGLVTAERNKLLAIEGLAAAMYGTV
jgi:hypothetical protein